MKDKDIYCPKCKSFLTRGNAESNRTHKLACKKCRKWIWFNPATGESEVRDIPLRQSLSGKRFY